MSTLINRARILVAFVGELKAAAILIADGIDTGDVFLAVKAASVLSSDNLED